MTDGASASASARPPGPPTGEDEILVVFSTVPDAAHAERLAGELLARGLAACVSSFPVTSRYEWNGALESAQETQLIVKTTASRYAELESAIRVSYPYELPEILALPVARGLPAYLSWVATRASPARENG